MEENAIVVPTNTGSSLTFNREIVDLIKKTVANNLTDTELQLFLYTAKRMELDPLARQVYAIKRNTKQGPKMTIQTGIDGYRVIAARNGLAGIDEAIHDNDDVKPPKWSKVTVYRMIEGQRVPYTATARWDEYYTPNNDMWNKMPFLMLDKCAEALALRKAFPNELSGIYTNEEMMQASTPAKPEPPITDEIVLAKTFINKSGEPVSIEAILGMEHAQSMLDKLEQYVTDARTKSIIARAKEILIERAAKTVEPDPSIYDGTPFEVKH